MNHVVRTDGVDLLLTLKFRDRHLRNKDRIVAKLSLRFYPAELARAKYIARIWERRSDANRPGLRVQLPINEYDVALVRIDFAIRKRQCQGNFGRSMKQVAATRTGSLCQGEIFAVTDGEVDLDGIELRDRSQYGLRTYEIPDLSCGLTGYAGYQRPDFGKSEIEIGRRNRSLGSPYGSFRLGLLLNLVIELATCNCVRLGQWSVAVHIDLSERQLRLRLPQLSLRLLKRCLKRTGIDLEEDLILLDLRTFAIILADQVTVRLGLDLGIDIAIEGAHPLPRQWHIALLGLYDRHFHCRPGSRSCGTDAATATCE